MRAACNGKALAVTSAAKPDARRGRAVFCDEGADGDEGDAAFFEACVKSARCDRRFGKACRDPDGGPFRALWIQDAAMLFSNRLSFAFRIDHTSATTCGAETEAAILSARLCGAEPSSRMKRARFGFLDESAVHWRRRENFCAKEVGDADIARKTAHVPMQVVLQLGLVLRCAQHARPWPLSAKFESFERACSMTSCLIARRPTCPASP